MRFTITHLDVVDSTNSRAEVAVDGDAPEGTVIVADVQTRGRGRKGDPWISPEGGLWFSLILRPVVTPEKSLLLPLLMGIAVHRAVKRHGVETRIKLPNDLLVEGKKLCGILCENRIKGAGISHVVVGVGVNVLNEPPPMGVSLGQLLEGKCASGEEGSTPSPFMSERAKGPPMRSPSPRELMKNILDEFAREYEQFLSSDYYFGDGYQ